MSIDNNVMRKLGKIKAHMESAKAIGSEAEAQNFARILNELLMKHNMEMTEIEWDAEIKDEPVDRHPVGGGVDYRTGTYKDYPDVEIKRRRCEWSENLMSFIAKTYGCSFLLNAGSSRLTIVGRKSNAAIVDYMYITMYRTIESLSWKEYKTARNKLKWSQMKLGLEAGEVNYGELSGFRASWIDGFVDRIRQLLQDEVQKQAEAPNGSTALMRIDKDKQAVGQYLEGIKSAKNLRSQGSWNRDAYEAGSNKASEVGITAKGMGASGEPKGSLN